MANNQDQPPAETKRRPFSRFKRWITAPLSKTSRGMLALGGIVLPVICHLTTLGDPPHGGQWQSGRVGDQLAFVLTFRGGFPFYPLMIFSIITLAIYLYRWPPKNRHQAFWIQLGTFNGILVSFWYLCIWSIVASRQVQFDLVSTLTSIVMLLTLLLIPLVIWILIRTMLAICGRLRIPLYAGILSLVVLYIATMFFLSDPSERTSVIEFGTGIVGLPIFIALVFAPVWSFTAYGCVGIRLLTVDRQPIRFTLIQLMSLVTYFAGLITVCRTSVWLSLQAYAELPTERPSNCYVATAAARGHPWLVGANRSGSFPINRQMQMLKALEIVWKSLFPSSHHAGRRIYNRWGPRIASHLDRPWKADLAYLALKPIELLTAVAAWVILGKRREVIARLYGIDPFPSRRSTLDC